MRITTQNRYYVQFRKWAHDFHFFEVIGIYLNYINYCINNMCVGDDPVARAMPYFISGIILAAITVLIYITPIVKKWKPKYAKIAKIVLIIISVILLFLAFVQYTIRYKCV